MLHGMTIVDGEQRWRMPDGMAWVAGDDRIALIDTTSPVPVPLHMAEPTASLWQALGDGPLSVSELRSVAEQLVDNDPEGFVDASLEMLLSASLVLPAAE